LDVDILLFGQDAVHEPDLLIPHPRLRQRAFVLVPLADIAPELTIPDEQGGSVRQALAKIPFKISGNVITAGT
jgi:7,8-dihydro-6-hydroxymethylpterin-pyrophosphokinase